MSAVDPRTVAAIREVLRKGLVLDSDIAGLMEAIEAGKVPGLTTCDLPPEPLPVGQVRRDYDGNLWARDLQGCWRCLTAVMGAYRDVDVREWEIETRAIMRERA